MPLSTDQSTGLPVNMTWTDTNLRFYPLVLRDEWGNWFPHPSLNARLLTFSQTWKPRNQFPSLVVWRKVGGVFLWFRGTDWCCRASHGSLFSDRLDSSTEASLRMQMYCGCSRHAVPWKDLHPPTYTPEWKESNIKLVGLQWWLESSVHIRVLGCSVTFLSNYHEVPLGFEVSLCSGYSNEMECTMVSWWSLRSFLEGNRLLKILPNLFELLCFKMQHAHSCCPHHTAGEERRQRRIPLLFASITPPYFTRQLDPSSLPPSLPALTLSLLSLGLTLSRYHIPREECKSYPSNPNPVTAELLVLTAPTLLQGHMIFSMYQT